MDDMERIVQLCLKEAEFEDVRSPGPGGQNVNKVATAVQLRFDAAHARHLDEGTRHRLRRAAGKRMTSRGQLVIRASRHRTQAANRRDALERFEALLRAALVRPRRRLATHATAASHEKRLHSKKKRGEIKRLRRAAPE